MSKESKWLLMFDTLRLWIECGGKLPKHGERGSVETKLAIWCSEQRLKHQKGILLPDRKNKLESLNYWYWDRNLDILNKRIARAYTSKNKSMNKNVFINKKKEISKVNPKSVSKSKRRPIKNKPKKIQLSPALLQCFNGQ